MQRPLRQPDAAPPAEVACAAVSDTGSTAAAVAQTAAEEASSALAGEALPPAVAAATGSGQDED
eukprot:13242322-Alexandrium_andersonii.AAC.1